MHLTNFDVREKKVSLLKKILKLRSTHLLMTQIILLSIKKLLLKNGKIGALRMHSLSEFLDPTVNFQTKMALPAYCLPLNLRTQFG